MFEMDLFPWGATVALWILPILFTMYTWRRPWAEALERTVRYHFIASAIYLGIGVFSGAEGIVAYGLYWLISRGGTGTPVCRRGGSAHSPAAAPGWRCGPGRRWCGSWP